MKNFFSNLLATILVFFTSTGLTWFGYGGGAVAVFFFMPKNWFWGVVFGLLAGLFVRHNLEIIKPWAIKQWKNLISKF